MSDSMTPRGRIEAAHAHIAPDRTPYFEYVFLSPLAEFVLGRKYPDFLNSDPLPWKYSVEELGFESAVRKYAVDRLDIAQKLRHDMLYVVYNPPERRKSVVSAIAAPPKPAAPASPVDDPVERVRIRNQRALENAEVPWNESIFFIYEALGDEMRKRGIDLPILVPAWHHGVWTDTDLMETMILEPELAHEHYRIATIRASMLIDRFASYGIRQIGIGGDFAGSRPLISPDSYNRFIVPELKILSDRIHAAGAWSINASDGNLWSVIDGYLVKSGVDGCIEIDSRASMDLAKLKAGFGKTITFYGNMDCGEVLSFYSPDEIREITVRCIEDGRIGGGGHVFCSSNAITASVPPENYFTMVNAYMDYFGLPKIRI